MPENGFIFMFSYLEFRAYFLSFFFSRTGIPEWKLYSKFQLWNEMFMYLKLRSMLNIYFLELVHMRLTCNWPLFTV